jgi:membrane protein
MPAVAPDACLLPAVAAEDHPDIALGRLADSPEQIPPAGWREILGRVWQRGKRNGIAVTAAGIAFYMILSVFPAVLALMGLFGLFLNPDDVERRLAELGGLLPPYASEFVIRHMREVSARNLMGLGAVGGLLIGFWSASAGVRALMQACNVAYDIEEQRPILHAYRTSLVLTVFAITLAALAVILMHSAPFILKWLLIALLMMLALAVLYRYAPCRKEPRWEWVSWGAGVATLLWLMGTGLLSLYVSNFDRFNHLYGALGAVVILLLWLLLTGHAILLGAELNAEMERQTKKDTSAA